MDGQKSSSEWLSITEAATQLKLSPEQVHDLIAAGELETTGQGEALQVLPLGVAVYVLKRAGSHLQQIHRPTSALTTACGILLPPLIGLWFMAVCAEVFSIREGKIIVPVPAAIVILTVALALAWWMARQTDDFSSVNGVGTALRGRRLTPEGRVGTQWVVFTGIPLVPVRSYVILEEHAQDHTIVAAPRVTRLQVRPLGRMYWPQVLPTLAAVWAGVAVVIALAIRIR